MKKFLMASMVVACIIGFATTAKAVPLSPGLFVISLADPVPSGDLVAQLTDLPFIGEDENGVEWFQGTLDQWVYMVEGEGLLFVYQVSNEPIGVHADHIQTLSTTDYSGFTTDVDVDGVAGKIISRGSSGSTVTFNFLNIEDNTTSPLYWVQTNASYYTWGGTNLIDGGTANLRTYCPTAIPEPASMVLLGIGILGLFGLGRKKA